MSGAPVARFRIDYARLSDIGMRRANNQDSIAAAIEPPGNGSLPGDVLLVADGMGAHAAGELASKIAADTIPHTYRKRTDLSPPAALRHAVREANTLIYSKGQGDAEFHGMGTTCSCLVLLEDAALVAHVGDSRVYRLRGGRLEQLTFDHSLVWELAAHSHTATEQVPDCIPKNVITRSLGPHEQVNVDLEGPYELQPGDVFLICSDGLTGVVEDELIGALLGAMPPGDAAQTLIDLANLRGGPDNVSVVVASVRSADADEASPTTSRASITPPDGPSAVSLGVWLALAGCFVAACWFGSQQRVIESLVAAAGFGAAVVVALMQRRPSATADSVAYAELGGPYGDGPYRTFECEPGEPAAAAIAEVVAQLAELEGRAPPPAGPPVNDWTGFHDHRRLAEQALESGDSATALRRHGAAIRTLMEQVRTTRSASTA